VPSRPRLRTAPSSAGQREGMSNVAASDFIDQHLRKRACRGCLHSCTKPVLPAACNSTTSVVFPTGIAIGLRSRVGMVQHDTWPEWITHYKRVPLSSKLRLLC
jgi:hypothetical protein